MARRFCSYCGAAVFDSPVCPQCLKPLSRIQDPVQELVKRWVVSLAQERDWVSVIALGAGLMPFPPSSLLALGLGIWELRRIKRGTAPVSAQSFATWAVILGAVGLVIGVVAINFGYGLLSQHFYNLFSPFRVPPPGFQKV